jgi:alpha-tubulin suppressor-like RCC1 family protein
MIGGHSSGTLRSVRADIPFLIEDMSFSNSHSILRSDQNEYYVTGESDHYALLGRDTASLRLANKVLPIFLNTNETIVKFDVGHESNLFLTSEGRLFTSGLNKEGQIGNNTVDKFWGIDAPVNITSFFNLSPEETIIDVFAGKQTPVIHHALTSFNRLFVWGANPQASDIEADVEHYAYFAGKNPSGLTDVEAIRTPYDITSIFEHTVGIDEPSTFLDVIYHSRGGFLFTTENDVWTWGKNDHGLLGNGMLDEDYDQAPVKYDLDGVLAEDETIIGAEMGNNYVVALTSDNRFVAWGSNALGKIKSSTETFFSTPQIIENTGVTLEENETILDYFVADNGIYFVTTLGKIWMRGYTRIFSIANFKSDDELQEYRQDMTWVDVTLEMPVFDTDERVVEILGLGDSFIFLTNTKKLITQYYFATPKSILFKSGGQNFVSGYYDNARYYFFIGDAIEPALTVEQGDTFTLPKQPAEEGFYHAGWGFEPAGNVVFQTNFTFTFNYNSHFRLYPIFVEGIDPNSSSETTTSETSSETTTSSIGSSSPTVNPSEPNISSEPGEPRPSAVGPIIATVASVSLLGGGFYFFVIQKGAIGGFSLLTIQQWWAVFKKRSKDKDDDKK